MGSDDPRTHGIGPPLPKQQQVPPGATAELDPVPDHGEQSYRGSSRLDGRNTASAPFGFAGGAESRRRHRPAFARRAGGSRI